MWEFFGNLIGEFVLSGTRSGVNWLYYRIRYPNKWQREEAKRSAEDRPPFLITVFLWILLIAIGMLLVTVFYSILVRIWHKVH